MPSSTTIPRPRAVGGAPATQRKRDELLETLIESSVGLTGQDFLNQAVSDLSRALGVRYLFAGEILPCGARASSLVLAVEGEVVENFQYDLAGTPCLIVAGGEACFIEDSAADLFPEDVLLSEMGVESYFGFPLSGEAGAHRGLVVALHDAPIQTDRWMRNLFRLFAGRMGAEMSRIRAEKERVAAFEQARDFLAAMNRMALSTEIRDGDVDGLARKAVRAVRSALDAQAVGVWLVEPDPRRLVLRVVDDPEKPLPVGTSMTIGADHFDGGERVRALDRDRLDALDPGVQALARRRNRDGWVEGAIRVDNELIGVLAVVPDLDAAPMAPGAMTFIADVADLIARSAVEARRQEADARHLALERDLEQARKMEALGSLAGGIAHDFNNILGVMLANVELALEETDGELSGLLADVRDTGLHGRELISQIFQFVNAQVVEVEAVDPEALIYAAIRNIPPAAGAIRQVVRVEPDLPPLQGDRRQLSQALSNLACNALQSLDSDGMVELGCRIARRDEVEAYPQLTDAPHMVIWVRDDGPGIPADVRARIFEPFFTTRRGRGGTGLGMSIVDRVVRAHRGVVELESEVGAGTCFKLFLPVTSK